MRRGRLGWRSLAVSAVVGLVAGGCAMSSPKATTTTALDPGVRGCDVLLTAPVGHDCLLPWPNNAFTVASTQTVTRRRLAVSSRLDPTNVRGVHASTTFVDQGDGFSPGSVIMTYVPDLDLVASHIASSTDIGSSLDANAPIVVLDTATGERVPYFAELDAQTTDTAEQLLLIHPAVALTEAHRYAVVLRHLVDNSGHPIAPLPSTTAAWNARPRSSARMQYISKVLHHDLASVIGSTEPYMAWDFTVASEKSLAGPALTMHTLAYAWLVTHHMALNGKADSAADYAPAFTVTSSTTTNGVRDVHGTFQVPLFLTDTTPFSAMTVDHAGSPVINGTKTWTANFICVLPSTISPSGAALPTVYGHGLLGSASEVEGSSFSAALARNMAGCATDWVGMSAKDIPNVERNLNDMSTFNTQVDHMLQGFVNFQFLGRLINSPAGFASNPAFQDGSGKALFQVGKCTFMGYSQGGIMGGAVSAVSTEWTRVILGVPGMDYGGLLLPALGRLERVRRHLRQGVHQPRRPAGRAAVGPAAVGPGGERGLRRAPDVEPLPRDPGQAGLHHRELRRPPGGQRLRGDAGAHHRRPQSPARVQSQLLRCDATHERARHGAMGPLEARPDQGGEGRDRAVGLRHPDAAYDRSSRPMALLTVRIPTATVGATRRSSPRSQPSSRPA